MPTETSESAAASPAAGGPSWPRLAALAALLVVLFAVGKATGLTDDVTPDGLRASLHEAGPWGAPLLIAAFVLGGLIHIPGTVFIGAAVFAYDRALGGALAFTGALASIVVSFWVVRLVGGRVLAAVDRPLLRRALARLDDRPVRTVFWLRMVFWTSPPLNYALALSSVRFRDYLAGSALGLTLPAIALALAFEWVFRQDPAALLTRFGPWALGAAALAAVALLVLRRCSRSAALPGASDEAAPEAASA